MNAFSKLIILAFGCLFIIGCSEKEVDLEAMEERINAAILKSPSISEERFLEGNLPIGEKDAITQALADARKVTQAALSNDTPFELRIRVVQLFRPDYVMRDEKMEERFVWAVEFLVFSKTGEEELGFCGSIITMTGFMYSHFRTSEEKNEVVDREYPLPFMAERYESYWPLRSKKRYAKATTLTGEYGGRAVASGKLPMSFATAASRARAHCQAAVERYAEVYGGDKDGISIKDVATVGYLPEKESWFVEFYFETAEGVRDTMGFKFFLPIEILANGECFPFLEDFVQYTGDPNVPRPEIEE